MNTNSNKNYIIAIDNAGAAFTDIAIQLLIGQIAARENIEKKHPTETGLANFLVGEHLFAILQSPDGEALELVIVDEAGMYDGVMIAAELTTAHVAAYLENMAKPMVVVEDAVVEASVVDTAVVDEDVPSQATMDIASQILTIVTKFSTYGDSRRSAMRRLLSWHTRNPRQGAPMVYELEDNPEAISDMLKLIDQLDSMTGASDEAIYMTAPRMYFDREFIDTAKVTAAPVREEKEVRPNWYTAGALAGLAVGYIGIMALVFKRVGGE